MGDPAGIGPETICGAWRDERIHQACRLVAVGNPSVFERAAKLYGGVTKVVEVISPDQFVPSPALLPCLPSGNADAADIAPATIDPRGGQAAYDALRRAAQLALDGHVDGIVTAPLHKAALHAAGHHYPGHTELLAEFCGAREVAMMLYLPPGDNVKGRAGLGVVHVTLHTALRNVFAQLSLENIVAKAHLADVVSRALIGAESTEHPPQIGVCALNPHAGEGGLFGDEEQRIIAPAVAQAVRDGLQATGPLPADTLLVRAAAGEFDAVVAMYHDQGHIALKLLGMHRAVNITLGLPIVRTSVAHGTAFDLAWKGRAESAGLVQAIDVAAKLVAQRAALKW